MPERICSVEDCDQPTGVPGSARGYCGKHYQRLRNHGDPLYVPPVIVGVATCSIDGCTGLVRARGWCLKHWARWKRKGDPVARKPGEIVDGKRICPSCCRDVPLSRWGLQYCRECAARRRREWVVTHPQPTRPTIPARCDRCGAPFEANGRRSRYCNSVCADADRHRNNWRYLNARRARLRDAFVEHFDRAEIFERDNWTCQICHIAIDRAAPWPHPLSASLDHIVPLARGGKHERANAQASHLACNVRKGVSLTA